MTSGPVPPYAKLTATGVGFMPCSPEDPKARLFHIEYGLQWDASVHELDLSKLEEARDVLAALSTAFDIGARYQRLVAMQSSSEIPPDDNEEGVSS